MRKRTPGFVACINRKARNAVNIDIIGLLVIFAITRFQKLSELKLKTKLWRDPVWPFKDRSQLYRKCCKQIWLDTWIINNYLVVHQLESKHRKVRWREDLVGTATNKTEKMKSTAILLFLLALTFLSDCYPMQVVQGKTNPGIRLRVTNNGLQYGKRFQQTA